MSSKSSTNKSFFLAVGWFMVCQNRACLSKCKLDSLSWLCGKKGNEINMQQILPSRQDHQANVKNAPSVFIPPKFKTISVREGGTLDHKSQKNLRLVILDNPVASWESSITQDLFKKLVHLKRQGYGAEYPESVL